VQVYVEISHDSTVNELQTVLDVIYAWATEWQLQVSVEKCAILKIGYVSDNNDYYIKNVQLRNVMSCCDLGIIVTNELSPSEHVKNITVKAHQRANAILRCFASHDNKLLVRAFTTYVRPLLEYNSVVWSPYLK